MPDSNRYIRQVAVLLPLLAGAACAQPGASLPSPTAPSLLSPSASLSDARVSTQGGGASYDASGVWHLVIADQRSREVYDDVDTALIQQPDGTITFCGECEGELFTLTPRGARQGAAVPYELSYFGEGSPCNATLRGSALLDTRNNQITAHGVRGTSDDCSKLLVSISLTRTAD